MTKILFLIATLCLTSSLTLPAQSSDKKDLEKRKKKYWKNEEKIARSTDHEALARQYPETGWLSGVWCRTDLASVKIHLELQDGEHLRWAQKGYLAADEITVIKPEAIRYMEGEVMGKNVMVTNESYYDLWSYSGGKDPYGTGQYTYYVYFKRIKKVSETEFERVAAKSFTLRHKKGEFNFREFITAESPKIDFRQHFKQPQPFAKCD